MSRQERKLPPKAARIKCDVSAAAERLPASSYLEWLPISQPLSKRPCECKSSLTRNLPSQTSPWTFFEICFPSDIFDDWSYHTNLYATQKQNMQRDPDWKDTSAIEMKAFLGVLTWMSIIELPEISMYWNRLTYQDLIAKVFPRTRFQKLLSYWHLNHSSKDPNLVNSDAASAAIAVSTSNPVRPRFYKLEPLLTTIVNTCKRIYTLGENCVVDESMAGFTGRASGIVYLPDKPTKWGFQFFMLADCVTYYIWNLEIYHSRPRGKSETGLTTQAVTNLVSSLAGSNRVIHVDNRYMSVELCKVLTQLELYGAGTTKPSRKEFPKQLKRETKRNKKKSSKSETKRSKKVSPKKLKTKAKIRKQASPKELKTEALPKQGDSCFLQRGNMIATRWFDKRDVYFLSTAYPANVMSVVRRRQNNGKRIEVGCPLIVERYGALMGGVDRHNQLREVYKLGRHSKKWWHSPAF